MIVELWKFFRLKKLLFIENLGAYSSHDLGRHIHRYGGPPTGSFIEADKSVLQGSVAPALFMDITHDNESLIKVTFFIICLLYFFIMTVISGFGKL